MIAAAGLAVSLLLSAYDAPWAASLSPGAQVTVPSGIHPGPWRLAPGVHLLAQPGAILRGVAGDDAALTLQGDARVEGLAIEVAAGAYGIRISHGRAELVDLHLSATGHAKAGIYVAHAEVAVDGGRIEGPMDYGLLAEQATRIDLSRTTFLTARAGVAVVSGPISVEGCVFVGPFSEAAITLLNVGSARLTGNLLSSVKTMGIKLTRSNAALSRNRVSGARADAQGLEGDCLYAIGSAVSLAGDHLGDSGSPQGPVLSLLDSVVKLEGVQIQGQGEALIYLASGSSLSAVSSELHGHEVGLLVEEGSAATEAGFRFVGLKRRLMQIQR